MRQRLLTRQLFARLLGAAGAALCLELSASDLAPPRDVIISEICYDAPATLGPDALYEFVEIHNRGSAAADVSGWRLKDRDDLHEFLLPAGTVIEAGAYLVLARNAAALRAAYGGDLAIAGDVPFNLGNEGDTVRLLDGEGFLVDQVRYAARQPWPPEAAGGGATLERISALDDITDLTNFAASAPARLPGTPGRPNSRAGAIPRRHDVVINEIMYNPVKEAGAAPLRHCPGEEFLELHNRGAERIDISGWRFAAGIDFAFAEGTSIGPGGYLVLFSDETMFREKYGALANALGPYGGRLDDGGEEILLVDHEGRAVDHVEYNDRAPWPINPDGIRGSLELADPFADNDRGQAWEESDDFRGTPGAPNSAALRRLANAGNTPPQITAVSHRPALEPERRSILSSDEVRVEARALDRDGIAWVRLEYQVCAPGDYIQRSDARFESDWREIEMDYDPLRALHTARIPPQPHRTLVRYRVRAADRAHVPLERLSPRPRDPEPNHAYFVYDGVLDYIAGRRSAFGPPGHAHSRLDRVPVYHFIAAEADIEEAQYRRFPVDDNTYRWLVTFVHEDRVYDHCSLRLRSGHRYSWPKRPWRVRFNRGNLFRGRFNDGSEYPRGRRRLNLMTAQHDPGKPRGESGVFESLAWRLFREAGVLSAATSFIHLRIIRSPEEHDQFLGDFFGIFLDIQEIDATALQDNGRPADEEASLYKFEGGPVKRHPDCDPSLADVEAFLIAHERPQSREWFEAHLDIERYLSFRAVVELSDNHDMDSLKNFFYYFNSSSRRWEVAPWDLDNTFGAMASGDEPLVNRVLPLFAIEYRNRFRFLWQVLYDERRLFAIIDGWSSLIRELADADLDRWDTEPREACPAWPAVTGANCRQYAPFLTRMRDLKRWIRNRASGVRSAFEDSRIPATPANLSPRPGEPLAPPVVLEASAFADPDPGDAHARSRWMVIERGGDWAFPLWEEVSSSSLESIALPAAILIPGREYLFRAAYQPGLFTDRVKRAEQNPCFERSIDRKEAIRRRNRGSRNE
jgi:hypothetical protein